MLRRAVLLAAAVSLLTAPAALTQARGLSTNPADSPAGTYKLDPRHTTVAAQVSHFGLSNYTFLMRGVSGEIAFNPKQPTASAVRVAIDPKSVDTGLPDFDQKIGTDERFFAGKPITFVSRSLEQTAPTKGRLTGDLTLNGVTRPVTLDVTFNGGAPVMNGVPTLGFSATGAIKRSDFKVAGYLPPQVVGEEVRITIEAEFNKA